MSTKYEDKLTLDRHAMKDRATSHLRIYVGGIGEQASVDDLYEHFIQYGQIDGIVVNRNFGFVQFKEESSAQDAINKANGTLIQGKNVSVRTSQTNPIRREAEVAAVHPDKLKATAGVDKPMPRQDEASEELYDSYGNYVGDQGYREDEFEEVGYTRPEGRLANRGRGAARGEGRGAARGEGRGAGRGEARGAGRGRGRARGSFRERSPNGGRVPGGEWPERSYDRFSQPEYGRTLPVSERNDCEIIVVAKSLTEYAEYIEGRLKRLGIVVDLLFPMEDVPIGKVLGNIASRGCLYAILVMPQNQEQRSLTLTILHGLPQEHRNMPLEDALQLVSRNFQEVQRGGPSGREAVYALLGQLADGRALTVLQYDKVIDYLKERREQQVKIELGEPHTVAPATDKTQVELQQRILSILNDKTAPSEPVAPVVPKTQGSQKLFNDPTVRKALDSILQKFT